MASKGWEGVMKRILSVTWLALPCLVLFAGSAGAMICPLVPFNGNPDGLDLSVEVVDAGVGQIHFLFSNQSLIGSSMARLYFDDDIGLLAQMIGIVGDGTLFEQPACPGNLPGGRTLAPPFEAIDAFSVASAAARPRNGIEPGESAIATFNLLDAFDFDDVCAALMGGGLRIGVHTIALPDGSSVSAVTVPEPATMVLVGLGALIEIARKEKRRRTNV